MSYQYEDDFEADEASDVNVTTSEATTKSNDQQTSTEYTSTSHNANPIAGVASEERQLTTSSSSYARENSPLHVRRSNSSSNSNNKQQLAKGHNSTEHNSNDLKDGVKASLTATSSGHHSNSSHTHSSEYSQSSLSTSRSSSASSSSSSLSSSSTPHKKTKHVAKKVNESCNGRFLQEESSNVKNNANKISNDDDHDDHEEDSKSESDYETESSTNENEKPVENSKPTFPNHDQPLPTEEREESPRNHYKTSALNNNTNTTTMVSPGKRTLSNIDPKDYNNNTNKVDKTERTSLIDRNGQFVHHSNITSVEVRPTELSSFHGEEDSNSIEDEMCNSMTDGKAHSNNNNNKAKSSAPTWNSVNKVESKINTTTTTGSNNHESQQKSSLPVKSSLESSSSSSSSTSYVYEYEEEEESASSTPMKWNTSVNKETSKEMAKETVSSILTRDITQPSSVPRVSAGVQLEESKENDNTSSKAVKRNVPTSMNSKNNQMNSKTRINEVERNKPIISKVHPNGPIPDNCTWVDERRWLERKIEELKKSVIQYNNQIDAKERAINQAKQQAGKTKNNEQPQLTSEEAVSAEMAQLQKDNVHLENEYRVYYGAVIDVEFLLEQARMQLNVVQDQLRLLKRQRIQLGIRDRRAAHVIEETHTKLPPIEERHWRQVNDGYYGHAQLHKKINQLQRDIERGQESIFMIKHKFDELESVVHAQHFTQMPLKEFHALKEEHANNLKTIRHLRSAISIYQNAMNKERRGSSAAFSRRNSSSNSKVNSRISSAASHPREQNISNNNNNNNASPLNYINENNTRSKRVPSARSLTSFGINDELHDEVDGRLVGEQNELRTRQAELHEVIDDLNNKIEQRIAQYNANVEFVKQRTASNSGSNSNSLFAATPIYRERKVHKPLVNDVVPERANTSSAAERRKSSGRRNTSDHYDVYDKNNNNNNNNSKKNNNSNVNKARGRNTRKENEINVANTAVPSRSDSAPIPIQEDTNRPHHLPELTKTKNKMINNENSNNNGKVNVERNEKGSVEVAKTKADDQARSKGKNTDKESARNTSLQQKENSLSDILEAIDKKNKQIQRDIEREVKNSKDTHVEQTKNAQNRNQKQRESQQHQESEEIKEILSAEEEEEEDEYEYEYEEESEEDESNEQNKKGVTGEVNENIKLKKQENDLASTNSSEISNPFVKNSYISINNNKKTTNTCSAAVVEQPKEQKQLPVIDQKINSSVESVKRSGQLNNNNITKVQPSLTSLASSGRSTPEWLR